MKKRLLTTLLSALFISTFLCGCAENLDVSAKHRKVALQCYTFKKFTLEETLEKTKHLGFDALEGTPAQKISAAFPAKISPDTMTETDKAELKRLLKKYGQKFVSYGVVSAKNEADAVKYCKFANEFGIGAILTEDAPDMFPVWQKVGEKYGVKMFLHHHASNSSNQYFNPDVMMKFVSKYPNVMANPDNGHWSRSGINSVEGFKKLAGEIGSIHLKDQRKFGDSKNDPVPYGEGELELKKVLRELDSQKYDGYFVVEYEAEWDNPLPSVEKCVLFLRKN